MTGKNGTSLTNLQMILRVIIEKGPITKREIQDITGFSWGLVSAKVNALEDMGYIVSDCRETDNVGRKAEEYDVNHNMNLFVGIDIHCEGILVVLTDMKGRVVEQEEREFSDVDRSYILELLFHILDQMFEKHQGKNILGIGVGVQGVVDRINGVSVLANGIDEWQNVPIKQIFSERYGLEVFVEHDTDCLMLAESNLGHLNQKDVSDAMVVSVNFNVGVGMSVLINGEIYRGWHGKAAELGYSIVDESQKGNAKLLESHSVKKNLVHDYKEMTGSTENITYEQIVKRAYEGDANCKALLARITRYLSIAVCSANNILNPEVIILYAPTCEFKDFLYSYVKGYIAENAYDKEVTVKFSKLGRNARAVGGALSAIEMAIYKVE